MNLIASASGHNVPIEVLLPSALLVENGMSPRALSAELLRAYIISLFRRDRISAGKAAELLDVPLLVFSRMLVEEGLSYFNFTTDELDVEMAVAQQWPKR